MESLTDGGVILARSLLGAAFLAILVAPAWWLAGRLQGGKAHPFFRLLCAIGLALVGYVSFVNLLGRLLQRSLVPVAIYLLLSAAVAVITWRRWPEEVRLSPLRSTWRSWAGVVALALVLGLPQWLLATSTPYWDEVASSAIHVTAPNQFAEGVFPPRHNALPDVSIKYHYGFTILSGTVRWLTGLSANVSIDVASTGLWLFSFLFAYFWLRDVLADRVAALWGAVALLLGGGLGWLYLPRIEAYDGVEKLPPASALLHRYDPSKSWLENLIEAGRVPSDHLRNVDGTLSNLPWDIAAQFQQHAVALGIALTLFTLYLFVSWLKREEWSSPLFAANLFAFSVLPLAHAVFGGVAAVCAGLWLLGSWLRKRTRFRFIRGLAMACGLPLLALLHGGLFAIGSQYGATGDVMTLRQGLGYSAGGLTGFLHWNVAGLGLPLLLAIVAGVVGYLWRRDPQPIERRVLFFVLAVFTLFSYLVPQFMFYSSETIGVEQFTEISKFFFSAHLGLALLSAFAIAQLRRWVPAVAFVPGFAAMAITPLAFCYAGSFNKDHDWLGFYRAPYYRDSIEQQMGEALAKMKRSSRDVYFDASADERVHGYLGELLIFGGSVFTMTPSRYERTGIGYRLSEEVVARRFVQNGRMARLLPGAAEDCGCDWFYSRPFEDMALAPMIVRSRFDKAVVEGYFVKRFEAGSRVLYEIVKPTSDLDRGIEKYWRPRTVSQTRTDVDGDGKSDLIFFDYANRRILAGEQTIELPEWLHDELVQLYTASFPGEGKVDFLLARMKDTEFRLGKKIDDLVEFSAWAWSYRDSHGAVWQPEYQHWLWNGDLPVIADLDDDGTDAHVGYRSTSGEWLLAPNRTLTGPVVDRKDLPLPIGGRFLEGSRGDLGLWSLRTGMITLRSLATGRTASFKWGGRPGDVLVPGDYDGDGYDEIAVWQQTNRTWYWRRAPDGPISQATFGTDTCVPLPADYDGDGRLDLGYWEPGEGKVVISLDRGQSINRTVEVPPGSIPAFVNMY